MHASVVTAAANQDRSFVIDTRLLQNRMFANPIGTLCHGLPPEVPERAWRPGEEQFENLVGLTHRSKHCAGQET
eukprot:7639860-Alexandrium_andersonii.AAC.1